MTGPWYPNFGQNAAVEMLIGVSIGSLSFLKLFFPYDCPRSSFEVTIESLDYYVFFNQMSQDYGKNSFYLIQSAFTTLLKVPQIVY